MYMYVLHMQVGDVSILRTCAVHLIPILIPRGTSLYTYCYMLIVHRYIIMKQHRYSTPIYLPIHSILQLHVRITINKASVATFHSTDACSTCRIHRMLCFQGIPPYKEGNVVNPRMHSILYIVHIYG